MGCSQPKLSRTGLRNILAFLKVELQHFLGGTQNPGPPAASRPKGVKAALWMRKHPQSIPKGDQIGGMGKRIRASGMLSACIVDAHVDAHAMSAKQPEMSGSSGGSYGYKSNPRNSTGINERHTNASMCCPKPSWRVDAGEHRSHPFAHRVILVSIPSYF